MERPDHLSVVIAVASTSGTSELIAEDLRESLESDHLSTRLVVLPDDPCAAIARSSLLVVVSGTFGQGDVPANGLPFFEQLLSGRCTLNNRPYLIVAVGDSSYRTTFAGSAEHWDRALLTAGGQRSALPLKIDTCPGVQSDSNVYPWVVACTHSLQYAAESLRTLRPHEKARP